MQRLWSPILSANLHSSLAEGGFGQLSSTVRATHNSLSQLRCVVTEPAMPVKLNDTKKQVRKAGKRLGDKAAEVVKKVAIDADNDDVDEQHKSRKPEQLVKKSKK